MSYILEALKKLEQKQKREGFSTLLTLQGDAPERKRRRPLWLYLVLALLLLNAGMTLWWIAPWKSAPVESARVQPSVPVGSTSQPATTPSTPAKKLTSQERAATSAPAERKEAAQPRVSEEAVRERVAATSQATVPEKKPMDKAPSKGASASVAASPAADSRTGSTNTPSPGTKVISLQDLPPAVKSSLPSLKISMHYYSEEPRSRLVRINDTTLREGDVLTPPGMKVEEVAPQHILFSYQGYRFAVGIDDR